MSRFRIGFIGIASCLLGLWLPVERHKWVMSDSTYGVPYRQYVTSSLFHYSPIFALLIGVVAILCLYFLLQNDALFLKGICGLGVLLLTAFANCLRDLVTRDVYGAKFGLIPYYYGSDGGYATSYGWGVLLFGITCCLIAWYQPVAEEEKKPLVVIARSLKNSPTFVALVYGPPPTVTPQTAGMQLYTATPQIAVPSDVGECAQCGTRNSKQATRCYKCGATLPWVKVKQPKAPVIHKPPPADTQKLGEIAALIPLTLLTFIFCSSAPLLGFFLWKHMENEESRYKGAALAGTIIGFLLTLLVIVSRMMAIMSHMS